MTCEAVVCAMDALCCSMEWDGLCADQALVLCPGECGDGTGGGATGGSTTGGGGPDSDCCTASAMGLPGCIDDTCEILVCALDATCCNDEWDALCAVQAGAECPICGGGGGSGGIGGDCCMANGSQGCEDPVCEAVVCSMDALCCTTEWDALCADQALIHCPGVCP